MKLIVKAKAGSHLFGTNTKDSDIDYKGVYLPSAEDIILNRVKNSIRETTNPSSAKNNAGDLDIEYYSLNKFLRMLEEGQTVALELLFTPDHLIVEKSSLWDFFVENREKFLHKKVTAFVGYCKQQASKYGIKGSRIRVIKDTIERLDQFDENLRVVDKWEEITKLVKDYNETDLLKIIKIYNNPQKKYTDYLEVCNRKFEPMCSFKYVKTQLSIIYDRYGERAQKAEKNEGIDWKALSHAFRACIQARELLLEGYITLPLQEDDRVLVKAIKMGNIQYKEVSKIIEEKMANLDDLIEQSSLPEQLPNNYINDIIKKVYKDIIIEETGF